MTHELRELVRLAAEVARARSPAERERRWQVWRRAAEVYRDTEDGLSLQLELTVARFVDDYQTLRRFARSRGSTTGTAIERAEVDVVARRRDPQRVFVVHGRDAVLRDDMFALLRTLGLDPLEWEEAVRLAGPSPYIGDVLKLAFDTAQAVVVMLSPDDEGRLRSHFQRPDDEPHDRNTTPQPRLNVVFEAGWAMGSHPERTILVEFGERIRRASDLIGRHSIRPDRAEGWREAFVHRLRTAGCPVNDTNDDYLRVGTFRVAAEDAPPRRRGRR